MEVREQHATLATDKLGRKALHLESALVLEGQLLHRHVNGVVGQFVEDEVGADVPDIYMFRRDNASVRSIQHIVCYLAAPYYQRTDFQVYLAWFLLFF